MTDKTTAIDEIEVWLGCSLPSEYREFLETCEVELTASDLVLLYRSSTFIERNETYETKKYCPGFVTVGNDGGDMEVMMSLQDSSIYVVDGGSMQMETAEPLHTVFTAWLKANCPIPEFKHESNEWPVDPLTPVCIYLEHRPSNLSNLLMIKRHLGIATTIAELKKAADRIPCRIADEMTYAKAKVVCRRVNDEDRCVGIRLAADETRPLPHDNQAQPTHATEPPMRSVLNGE
jgi:hypothetical protein